ncbi:hypothetical protein CULCOIPH002_08490 [Corynebacterium ulcerans]|uniref:Uncharacterized protein n=1 Tax=Corynebacterium ulcerans TaxID=65058 RepID=A0ABD0BI08_CORUL|nr:putative secreted protein [Corynebacterium ulcerans 0102]GJJ33255.1 hypothetical protein CULCOIPH001_04630 [Corynebacterium ulcerans]GJJ35937.1 hypothetical protein CULCOIPH002_08490 [Corynebacterium ulcerans]GJJ38872.1 hypothetical protein CULCOIPH003_15030 [Corynebacterium ulcerans]GJJ39981.1 hypothetical protein CULCOIPH004_03920 [Corynebacterium ulcerans]
MVTVSPSEIRFGRCGAGLASGIEDPEEPEEPEEPENKAEGSLVIVPKSMAYPVLMLVNELTVMRAATVNVFRRVILIACLSIYFTRIK